MKFYSEVTKEMYDTVEALQAAEKISLKAEKEEDINEIFDLVKEASELEKKILKKMADYDQKYGFGSVATDLLKKAGVDNKKLLYLSLTRQKIMIFLVLYQLSYLPILNLIKTFKSKPFLL